MTTPSPTDAAIEAENAEARVAAARLKTEIQRADPDTLRLLFTQARTHFAWQDRPVGDDLLRDVVDLMKWGPTASNQQPVRFVFVRSPEAKARLKPHLSAGNVDKTMTAPVTAIVCHDWAFYEKLPKVNPIRPGARDGFVGNEAAIAANAPLNGTLQAAYFIIAARAVGLDCGPMAGFDRAGVDAEFLAGTQWRSSILCNLGYGDPTKLFRRLPRLTFDEMAQLI